MCTVKKCCTFLIKLVNIHLVDIFILLIEVHLFSLENMYMYFNIFLIKYLKYWL
jgi:hypothetical protein